MNVVLMEATLTRTTKYNVHPIYHIMNVIFHGGLQEDPEKEPQKKQR